MWDFLDLLYKMIVLVTGAAGLTQLAKSRKASIH